MAGQIPFADLGSARAGELPERSLHRLQAVEHLREGARRPLVVEQPILARDAGESNDLAKQRPELLQELRETWSSIEALMPR